MTRHRNDRRGFLVRIASFLPSASLAWAALGHQAGLVSRRTCLILLGTAGGPRPKRDRSAAAQAVVDDDTLVVIDCGDGVAR